MDDKALRPAQLGDGDHDLADQGAACFSITIDDDHVARPNKIQGLVNKKIVAGRHAYRQGGTSHYGGRAVERPEAERPSESDEIDHTERRTCARVRGESRVSNYGWRAFINKN